MDFYCEYYITNIIRLNKHTFNQIRLGQMVVLLFIDGLRAAWMMSEQMVLWEHERTADEKTPDLSPLETWKKEGIK